MVDQGLTKLDNILEVLQITLIFLYFFAINVFIKDVNDIA